MPKNLEIDRLDDNLRPAKVDGETAALEISKDAVKTRRLECDKLTVHDRDIELGNLNITTDPDTVFAQHNRTKIKNQEQYLNIEGNIVTIAASGDYINFRDGSLTFGYISMDTSQAFKIVTTTAPAYDFVVDSHGDIELDSHNGNFIAKKAGTEFSVANSAYAGMILGYTTDGIDAADDSYTLTTSFTVTDAAHKVKFVAPPSGVVEIFVSIFYDSARRWLHFGLSDNATYNAVDVTHEHEVYIPGGTVDEIQINHRWVITGLTAGTAYEYWLGAKIALGSGGVLRWGGNATGEWQPFIMKATALPAATTDYAVYG